MFWSTRATYSSTLPPVLVALMKLLVPGAAEGLVGRGMNPSKNCEVGLRRPAGITFPANAVRAQTAPAAQSGSTESGSNIVGTPAAEKSPARSAAVGTIVENTVPDRRRYASQLKKKKVLSLITGPPKVAPYWFWVN